MPGSRYVDWTHLRVVGNRDEAARYVPEARKLLGYVVQEAKRAKLGVFQVQRRLPDGALLVGEVHGAIPRITIQPPPRAGEPQPVRLRGGFVTWPKSDTVPDGYHDEHPQAWLTSLTDERWATLYFDTQDPPWSNVTAPRGTYRLFADGRPMFPNGLNHAGNIDWLGPEDELRLSWYGPRGRYHPTFFDDLRKLVFYRGKVLLDLEAYASAHGRADVDGYVLGAAIKGERLYVLSTSDFGYRDDGAATHKLVRFVLTAGNPADGLAALAVKEDEAESPAVVLWSAARDRSPAPYFFNGSVTQACRVGYKPGTNNDDENELATLTIDPDDVVSLSIAAANLVTSITRTEIFPPVTIPGTTYVHDVLDEPASVLVGRDFLGDTPKDVVVEYRTYDREDKTAQDGLVKIEWAERLRLMFLHVGSLEIPYLTEVSKSWMGNLGTMVKPNELLATFDFHYPLALDARFDAAATLHVVQRFYGDLWNMGDYNEVQADCETRVFFGATSEQLGARVIPRQFYSPVQNFEVIVGGDLWGIHGPLSWLNEVSSELGRIGTWTQGHDLLMLELDRFIAFNAADWRPGIEDDDDGFEWQAALPCLREPKTCLFAGINAIQPGESLAFSPNFDPIERTAIAGARPRLHPAWALTPPKQPT